MPPEFNGLHNNNTIVKNKIVKLIYHINRIKIYMGNSKSNHGVWSDKIDKLILVQKWDENNKFKFYKFEISPLLFSRCTSSNITKMKKNIFKIDEFFVIESWGKKIDKLIMVWKWNENN